MSGPPSPSAPPNDAFETPSGTSRGDAAMLAAASVAVTLAEARLSGARDRRAAAVAASGAAEAECRRAQRMMRAGVTTGGDLLFAMRGATAVRRMEDALAATAHAAMAEEAAALAALRDARSRVEAARALVATAAVERLARQQAQAEAAMAEMVLLRSVRSPPSAALPAQSLRSATGLGQEGSSDRSLPSPRASRASSGASSAGIA